MYYDHFGLKQAPFKITPNTDFFFAGANRGAILDALVYAINNGEGIIKVVGEVGSGKTMLSRMLQTRLPEKVECVYLANPSIAPQDVVFAIAFELQIKLPKNLDRLQAMQFLQKYLLARHAEDKQVVIFVEEAQGMPIATLEEIRLLTNLETKQDKLLQIVLFGQPELDQNLNASEIRQLRERITHSFNLDPIDQNAIRDYVIFRLRSSGYFGPPIFTEGAIKLLTKSSQGLVRRVNILADKAMLAAYSQNLYLVDVKQVAVAIRDSEFGSEQFKYQTKRKLKIALIAITTFILLIGLSIHQDFWRNLPSTTPAQYSASRLKPSVVLSPASSSEALETKPPRLAERSNTTKPMQTEATQAEPVQTKSVITTSSLPKLAESNADKLTNAQIAKNNELSPIETPVIASASSDALQQRIEVTDSWLKQQPENTVSVQLMGSSNEAQLMQHLNYLATRLKLENIYAYRTQVNKKPFITILYGSYASKKEAFVAIEQLPEDIKANQPQIRTIGGILKETSQFP